MWLFPFLWKLFWMALLAFYEEKMLLQQVGCWRENVCLFLDLQAVFMLQKGSCFNYNNNKKVLKLSNYLIFTCMKLCMVSYLLYFSDHNYPLNINLISAIKASKEDQRIKHQASHLSHLYICAKTLNSLFLPLWQQFYFPHSWLISCLSAQTELHGREEKKYLKVQLKLLNILLGITVGLGFAWCFFFFFLHFIQQVSNLWYNMRWSIATNILLKSVIFWTWPKHLVDNFPRDNTWCSINILNSLSNYCKEHYNDNCSH